MKIYLNLFKSGLKTLSIFNDIKLTKIASSNVIHSIYYRWSKESKYLQMETTWKSKKEYNQHSPSQTENTAYISCSVS